MTDAFASAIEVLRDLYLDDTTLPDNRYNIILRMRLTRRLHFAERCEPRTTAGNHSDSAIPTTFLPARRVCGRPQALR
ncbi:hypothetical protein AGR4A_Lc110049 [Agrobacterium tumefaciens str. B6]|uniref:Uncharacterized protein n=1 Tax=Agrobacterium tumefaciens str. B6 TaxID=1183423 RepID=A0A822V7F5_AGRTU|nr:hypothetical protein AGR4A_Lc110049 [Agrobacterium tumefaciens str. B6]